MNICVVSLFPEMIEGFTQYGIPRIAIESGSLSVDTVNPRDFALDAHRTVDDRPFGGGPGMVMKAEPLKAALAEARIRVERVGSAEPVRGKTIYLTPQGRRYDQSVARELSDGCAPLVLLAGRYEGIDERLIETEVDMEISLGDYVLSGGEVAAMAVIDSIARLLPGVLGSDESAQQDSFGLDGLLDCPHYTRPASLGDQSVPRVLMSGDHKKIKEWRRRQALQRTLQRRPDLLSGAVLSADDERLLKQLKAENRSIDAD